MKPASCKKEAGVSSPARFFAFDMSSGLMKLMLQIINVALIFRGKYSNEIELQK